MIISYKGLLFMCRYLRYLFTILTVLLFASSISVAAEVKTKFDKFPEKGIVTMIDLGAKKCIPCKMRAPILVKLKKAYVGKAAIVFIDVWENREQAKRFGIRAIPTQIFFNKNGKEIFRHAGFFDEKSIVSQLIKMGVSKPEIKTKG